MGGGRSSPFRVVIIPGTWSHKRYDWDRWQKYIAKLQQCGYAIYKFQWHASNSEKSRQEAVQFLREWLDKECEGAQKVVLIGHSYGGHVAALTGDHHLVSDVVTLAAPFISTGELREEQIAHNALALFTRAFLFPTVIWLTYTAYMYFSYGINGINEPKPGSDTYVLFAGIGSFIIYAFYVVVRLLRAIASPSIKVSIPNPAANGASVICVQVKGDAIVEQLESSASSNFSQAKSSLSFMTQEAIQPRAIRRWAVPYYFLCVLFLAHVFAFPHAASIFEVLTTYKDNHTLQALQGYFVFIVYVLLIRTLAKTFPVVHEIKKLLAGLSQLVDWEALARDNRRSVICLLAGLPLHARLVQSVDIRANLPGASIWNVDLLKSYTSLHKHSDVIKDDDVTSKVIGSLCSRIKQAARA